MEALGRKEALEEPRPETRAPAPVVQRLRVGIFALTPLQPRWLVEALGRVAASECASLTLLGLGMESAEAQPVLWDLYTKLDRRLFGSGPDAAECIDLPAQVAHEERLGLPSPATLAGWRARVATLKLDVAFALDGIDDGLLDGLARFGVWRFCAGDAAAGMDPLACAREVAEGAPLTATGLKVRLPAGGGERLVYASAARTHAFSAARNRDEALRKSANFALRALRELHRSGDAWLERCPVAETAAPRLAPDLRQSAWDVLSLGARAAWRGTQKLASIDQWSLAFRFGELKGWSDLQGFTRLVPPPDRMWADPFPLALAGRNFIFFEELLYERGKAHIAAIEIGRDGSHGKPFVVLERDYHLSYPFLMQHEGVLYMVPESSENGTVDLYRCVTFPHRWRLERTLMRRVRCADATLHRDGARWWMFAGVAGEGGALDDELHLFHAESLDGEWQPHDRNPVKSDVRAARPAGALFTTDEGLFRPAQVCAPLYGSAVTIQRVLRLTPDDYVEREVRRIVPAHADRLLGIHTFNQSGDLTVVDGFARRLRNPFRVFV